MSFPVPPNRLARGSAPLAWLSVIVSLPPRPNTWIKLVLATVGEPPTTWTAPPLTRSWPAALRLISMLLSRPSPKTVSTPALALNVAVTAALACWLAAHMTPAPIAVPTNSRRAARLRLRLLLPFIVLLRVVVCLVASPRSSSGLGATAAPRATRDRAPQPGGPGAAQQFAATLLHHCLEQVRMVHVHPGSAPLRPLTRRERSDPQGCGPPEEVCGAVRRAVVPVRVHLFVLRLVVRFADARDCASRPGGLA